MGLSRSKMLKEIRCAARNYNKRRKLKLMNPTGSSRGAFRAYPRLSSGLNKGQVNAKITALFRIPIEIKAVTSMNLIRSNHQFYEWQFTTLFVHCQNSPHVNIRTLVVLLNRENYRFFEVSAHSYPKIMIPKRSDHELIPHASMS